jgi:putative ABC transport system permease protein
MTPLWRRREQKAAELDEEINTHFRLAVEERIARGEPRQAAITAARREFGNVAHVKEVTRDMWGGATRERLAQDVRYAIRALRRSPSFTIVTLLTLALGIGANAAVFSVAYGVLVRPLPYTDASSLVRLWSRNTQRALEFFSVSPADYRVWRATNTVFSATAAYDRQRDVTLTRDGDSPATVSSAEVMPDVFSLLGARAALGRTLTADDARSNASPAVVIAHELWITDFGSDTAIVGREITLDGRRYTAVGIMPPGFSIPGTPARMWTPLDLTRADDDHGNRYLRVLARLKPGVTIERARTELDLIAGRLTREFPSDNLGWTVNMMSVPEMVVGQPFRRAIVVLLYVVGFVLLIACANAANLQLARAASRQREIAVRSALGASRRRLTTQLLTESLLLATMAGILGAGIAYGGLELLRAYGTTMVPRLANVRMDLPVLAFIAAVALLSGVLFGLVPSLRLSRADVTTMLKTGGRGAVGGIGTRMRGALVTSELTLSLLLLVGAGLLIRSFARLQAVDIGFSPDNVVIAPIQLSQGSYPSGDQVGQFFTELLDRARRMPGVEQAAEVSSAPFSGVNSGQAFLPEGRAIPTSTQAPDADYRVITPSYFATIGARLMRGRDFTTDDRTGRPGAIIVSEVLARRYWPNEDPIGKRVRVGDLVKGPMFTIVGVVDDIRYQSLETPEVRPMMYFSALAAPQRRMMLVMRTRGAGSHAADLRTLVSSLDPRLPVPTVSAMPDRIGEALATPRFATLLVGIFAGLALALASVGLYGLLSYLVRERSQELGVRLALGAPRVSLLSAVVGSALRLSIVGLAIGLMTAVPLTKYLERMLFGVTAHDPVTFVVVPVFLLLVTLLASLIPALRATRADPLVVLRTD